MDPEREIYAVVQIFCPFCEAIIRGSRFTDTGWSLLSFEGYLGYRWCSEKTACTLLAFPRIALTKCNCLTFPSCSPLKTYYARQTEIWQKSHPKIVVTHNQIVGLIGKACLKSATTAIAADGFRKTGLFSCNSHVIDGHDFLEVSQHSITSYLLESTSISEQSSTTSGTNPGTVTGTVTPPASQIASAVVLPSNIGRVPDISGRKQEQPTKHAAFPERVCCYFEELALQKQTSRMPRGKGLEIRGNLPKYGCRKRDIPFVVTQKVPTVRGEHEMKERREHLSHRHHQTPKVVREPLLIETEEENSDSGR